VSARPYMSNGSAVAEDGCVRRGEARDGQGDRDLQHEVSMGGLSVGSPASAPHERLVVTG
jgi:hypothetical protein